MTPSELFWLKFEYVAAGFFAGAFVGGAAVWIFHILERSKVEKGI